MLSSRVLTVVGLLAAAAVCVVGVRRHTSPQENTNNNNINNTTAWLAGISALLAVLLVADQVGRHSSVPSRAHVVQRAVFVCSVVAAACVRSACMYSVFYY